MNKDILRTLRPVILDGAGSWYNPTPPDTCFGGHTEIYDTFQVFTNLEYIFINCCSNLNSILSLDIPLQCREGW